MKAVLLFLGVSMMILGLAMGMPDLIQALKPYLRPSFAKENIMVGLVLGGMFFFLVWLVIKEKSQKIQKGKK